MKLFKIYSPWDTVVVEAKNAEDAKVKGLQQIIWEAQDASPSDMDAEEMSPEDEGNT
jgi:hypothetical protein